MVLVAVMAAVLALPGSPNILASAHVISFSPSTVTLDDISDFQTITVEVTGIAQDEADTVQINIVHDDAVISITSPACTGLYAGASATAIVRVDSDTASTFGCTLSNGPLGTGGPVVATFVITRLTLGEPTLTFGTSGPFLTAFIEAGSIVADATFGTLGILENHAPTADDQSVGTNEDNAVPVTLTGSDDNGDPLTFAVNSGPSDGVLSGTAPNLTYTPNSDFNGVDLFTYTATDDEAASSSPATITLTITAVNDEPSFTGNGDDTVDEDAGAQTKVAWATSISAGPSDESGQVLTFLVTNGNNALFSVQPAVSESTGDLTYTLATDANGSALVSVSISDNGGVANAGDDTSPVQTMTITVTAVNDVPVFTKGADQTLLEDAASQSIGSWATGISVGPANESAQTPIFLLSNDNNGLFSAQPAVSATGTLTFILTSDANGSATVSVQIQDDGGTPNGGVDTSAIQTFTVTVTAVNDAPSFTTGADESVLENSDAHTVAGWATSISFGPPDESAQVLTFVVSNDNNGLFAIQPAIASGGELTYTLAAETNGSTTVTVQLTDNGGVANSGDDDSPIVTFSITVDPVFNITGTITLQGTSGTTASSTAEMVLAIGPTITLISNTGGVGVATSTVLVASDGTFTLVDAPVDTYTITVAASGYQIAEDASLSVTVADVVMATINLKGGLVNGDTIVDGADVSLVISNFGTITGDRTDGSGNWVDINGDTAVSAIDISITISNLALTGTQAWSPI